MGSLNLAREEEVDAAVSAARAAYETGPWSTYSGSQRAALMHKFADLLLPNAEEIAKAETQAMGQPSFIVNNVILPHCADTWHYYAGWADKIEGQTYPMLNDEWRMTMYEPFGVCAGIGPWNVTLV